MKIDIRIRLFEEEALTYGKGINKLLKLCKEHKSLHKASEEMGMSYRKALQIVKRAENGFGKKILNRTIGGKNGGGSELTEFGENLVENFSKFENELDDVANKKLSKFLKDIN